VSRVRVRVRAIMDACAPVLFLFGSHAM
jgi:hypothetical protein